MSFNGSYDNEPQDDFRRDELEDTMMLRPSTDTEKITDKMEDANERLLFEPGTILFYIAGNKLPKLIQNANSIVVGRMSQVELNETPLDLTEDQAAELGVSRRHAAVHVTPQGYFIEDLKSTNGTWLNSNKLNPFERHALRSGDRIRFGELATHVYFTERREEIEKIYLQDMSVSEAQDLTLTPDYIADEIMVFIQAIADLQSLIDTAQNKQNKLTTIFNLRLDSRRTSVVVELTNVADAAHISQHFLDEIRQLHRDDIDELRESFAVGNKTPSTRSIYNGYLQKPQLFPKIVDTMLDPILTDVTNNFLTELGIETISKKLLKRYCFVLLMSPIKLREHVES